MAQIISASRRTDIPAFYTEWLKNRLKAGYCTVINPFNHKVSSVSLAPEEVRCFVFWTKNPSNMLMDEELFSILEREYTSLFLFTLNGYPAEFEPEIHPLRAEIIESFKRLSDRIGSSRVVWRYDPVIISNITDYSYHRDNFSDLLPALTGKTERVILSIVDIYRTVARRFKRMTQERGIVFRTKEELVSCPDFWGLMEYIREKAAEAGMEIQSCCESLDLEKAGIRPGKCIDDLYINRILQGGEPGFPGREGALPGQLELPGSEKSAVSYRKDPGQRAGCLCTMSREIGAAHTCGHKCVYCYASPGDPDFTKTERRRGSRPISPLENAEYHDPASPSLFGWFEAE